MRNSEYKNLYKLQDNFLHWMAGRAEPFYPTGGTALSRFYLHHRYSDDLDFFANQYQDFIPAVQRLIREMPIEISTDKVTLLIIADFCRFFIIANGQMLKIEFVNDDLARAGESTLSEYGLVDNPANILAQKALLSPNCSIVLNSNFKIGQHYSGMDKHSRLNPKN